MTWATAAMAVVLGLSIVAANEKPSPEYVAAMKGINMANGQLRQHLAAKDFDAIAADAAALKPHVKVAGDYWTSKKVEDAMKMSSDLSKAVDDLETAAKAKNEDAVMAAAKGVTGSCLGCHSAHREKTADGYEIK
jgi:cytochrome c556